MNYEALGLEKTFWGTCFEHVFSKACQYATIYENIWIFFKCTCFYLVHTERFAGVHNLVQRIKKRQTRAK
jgi:hypothetical protein